MTLLSRSFLAVALLWSVNIPSCDRQEMPVFSEFAYIPEEGINPSAIIAFSPEESDTALNFSGNYDLVMVVRYTLQCPSESLGFSLEEFSLDREESDSTRRELKLFNSKGRPLGKGGYGVFEIRDTIHRDYPVPEGYALSVSSLIPREASKGIKSVGLLIYRH